MRVLSVLCKKLNSRLRNKMRSQVFNGKHPSAAFALQRAARLSFRRFLVTSAIISLPTERPTESTHVLGCVAQKTHPKPTCLGAATSRLLCANKKEIQLAEICSVDEVALEKSKKISQVGPKN
jgi:hypothetical protein